MKQKKPLRGWRWVARVVSVLFDPVIVLPVIISVLVRQAYLGGQLLVAAILVLTDLVMPGLAFLYFMREHHFRDWDIHRRQQRFPILLVITLCQGAGVICAGLLAAPLVLPYLMAIWLVMVVFLLISLRWKISFHTGMNALLATITVLEWGSHMGWVFLVVVIVAWARVVDHDHTPAQVSAGALVPFVVLLVVRAWYI